MERCNCRFVLSLIEIAPNEWAARKSIIATSNWRQLPKIMIEKKWGALQSRKRLHFVLWKGSSSSAMILGLKA